ncbi:MAG TPA: hypothetical protein VFV38_43600 [Ktedonobacteraceae bacterium]|nr:hypothetical protein [Ktedonobacteraceae bacterium]
MEITDHVVLFYLHDGAEVYQLEKMQHFLHVLAAKGYYIFAEAESEKLWPLWHEWVASCAEGIEVTSPLQAGVSPQALSEVEQLCRERQDGLRLQGFSVATKVYSKEGRKLLNGFEWFLGFDKEEGVVYIAYLRQRFARFKDEWEAFPHWLEIVQLIYSTWHPIYGYVIDPRGGVRETSRDEVLAHKISYLYDINLFGPDIVEELGRERVESAPAQIVTSLDDGGIMLVPCENLLPDFYQYNYTSVAEHLGLANPILPWEAPLG